MFKVGRDILDAWTQCGRRLGLSKDMRRHIGEMIWDIHKYDGILTMEFHIGNSNIIQIQAGEIVSYNVQGHDYCKIVNPLAEEVTYLLRETFTVTTLLPNCAPHLNGTGVDEIATINALRSIIYKMPMPLHNIVLVKHRPPCGCTFKQKELASIGDAMEFMGGTYHGILDCSIIRGFGRMVCSVGNGPNCAQHAFRYQDKNKIYLGVFFHR